ncbi:MAG: hypothetical protein DRJ10_16610 [Bacteroidetes bacterium]|nr:MAG: hypothetical protein DRJ10_16610 [Bacteroidota bacterium]
MIKTPMIRDIAGNSIVCSICTKTPSLIRKRQERGFCRSEIQKFTFVNDCISEQKNEVIGVFLQKLCMN